MSDHASKADDRAGQRASDRRRAAKLRQRREQAGQVRIQAWVPRERAAYARQVLHAVTAGANALPSDPGQQAELDAARAEAGALRAELEETRAVGERAERDAQERADALQGELTGIRGRGGWRGVLLRLAGAGGKPGGPSP